ncbi:2-hydroxyglutaryl-CoA dehydratase, D-component [Oxobacter pfennigii]|uniref:2-hydroxyglutaryl-CoA dehydratase, D-component n=1 Tax=Oxobacter pfennigii TaxID=36849 RepID=A0A0P8YG91_9CLOT|nr:2-hydroxyacyl-CoA dehydratase [Oxobacter pfennigii]KPU46050.1 2-hydroxyglutaryl-CoA dehydratase, D-component [Oxobacter pfennigii]
MKATFPHMGEAYAAIKGFLEDLGVDIVIPPACNKKTLEIGTKNSPESACLPLKVNIGNYVQSIKMGADTVIITGSCGPCRFGYYGIVEKEILKDMGYDVDVIVFDPPGEDMKEFKRRIKKLTNGNSFYKSVKALLKGYEIAKELDDMNKLMYYLRPREIKKGQVKSIFNEYEREVFKVHGSKRILELIKETKNRLEKVEVDSERDVVKIGIIGEIYTVIEPFVNLYIEEKLGDLGVEVDRSMTVSGWIKTNLFAKLVGFNEEKAIIDAAKPYLPAMIGGHAQICIGNAVLYSKQGYDGVIQLLPFSCMPEIVASSILPTLSKKEDIPCMTLVVDELTGESGYVTRLEAFIDMIGRKKEVIGL